MRSFLREFAAPLLALALVSAVLVPAGYFAYRDAHDRSDCTADAFSVGTKVRVKAFPEASYVVYDHWCKDVWVWRPESNGTFPAEMLEKVETQQHAQP